jgi:hypothetical protein
MTLAYPKVVCSLSWWVCFSAEAPYRAWVDFLQHGRTFNFDRLPCATLQDKTSRSYDERETLLADSAHEATDSALAVKFRLGNFRSSPVQSGFYTQRFASVSRFGRAQVRTSFPCDEGVSLLLSRA